MAEQAATPNAPGPHGHAEIPRLGGLDPGQVGVLIFVSSEAFFFLTLIVIYIAYHGEYNASNGPTPHQALNVPLTTLFTVFLFSSSFTMSRATSMLGRRDVRGARLWLIGTVFLGAVFLAGQAYEYSHLYADSIQLGTNLWTSTFFTLTGFHGLHVLIGLISILVVTTLLRSTPESVLGARAVEGVSIYWHFVDAVWVIIYPVVYLWTLLS